MLSHAILHQNPYILYSSTCKSHYLEKDIGDKSNNNIRVRWIFYSSIQAFRKACGHRTHLRGKNGCNPAKQVPYNTDKILINILSQAFITPDNRAQKCLNNTKAYDAILHTSFSCKHTAVTISLHKKPKTNS